MRLAEILGGVVEGLLISLITISVGVVGGSILLGLLLQIAH